MNWFKRKQPKMTVEELANELHNAGLWSYHDYEKMGHSGDAWYNFRMNIARELLNRIDAYKR